MIPAKEAGHLPIGGTWLGSLLVRALDLRLDGCEFDSQPPRLMQDG